MASFHFLLLISAWTLLHIGKTQVFESTPGLVKVHEGDTADLIWTTTEKIAPRAECNFYQTSFDNQFVTVWHGDVIISNEYRNRCVYLNGTHWSGIRIRNITTADAKSKYIIVLELANYAYNEDAVVYVYQTPQKALLTLDPDDLREGNDLRLTCASRSNSLPVNNRPDVLMTYKWTRNYQFIDPGDLPDRHSLVGNDHKVLSISDIAREDIGYSYTCTGQEEGSRLQSHASEPYVINFPYSPGAASILGDSVVVAGDDVTLTCSAEDHGNPLATFKWKNPNGGRAFAATLTIDDLNVDDDEGDYECYLENGVAGGASANHTLIVNSVPGVERDLDSEKSVVNTDESFSVSCAFRAKPAASVVWKREDDSALPSGIFSTSYTQQADGKFTITTSTLTWSGTDADARRGKGGKMFCEADNGIRDPVKSNTMNLTIQYVPILLTVIPDDRIQFAAVTSSVYFFVEALSHPTPEFHWKHIFSNGTTINIPSESSGNKSNLTITNTRMEDFGNYAVSAHNEVGEWDDVMFELRELEKPHNPTDLSSDATAKSLILSWTPGWNGGAAQTFTISYSTDGFATTVPDIPDSPDSSQISYKLTEGISAKKSYTVSLLAINRKGSSDVAAVDSITTPGLPSFTVNSINIQEDKALIKWTLEVDLVDRVVVTAMDRANNLNHKETTVTNFYQDQTVIDLPSASSFIFDFFVYKGDDLLVSQANVKPNQGNQVRLGLGVTLGLVLLAALLFAALFFFRRLKNKQCDQHLQQRIADNSIGLANKGVIISDDAFNCGSAVAPGGVYETIDPLHELPSDCKASENYDEIRIEEDAESYTTMMRPISLSQLRLGSSSNVDSMLSLQEGEFNVEGQPPADILVMQPQTSSAKTEFAAKYLEGQVDIVQKLRNITNIEVSLSVILQQGLRQPVLNNPVRLLSDHMKNDKLEQQDNVSANSQEIYENNIQTVQSDVQDLFIGIANGLAQLHEVGALAYGLNTESVFVHEENGRLIAKLSSFSEASLVRQRDILDLEMGQRDVRRLAPETIDSLEHTCKSDVWVMAILFWEAISGCEPYNVYTDDDETEDAILDGCKLDKPAECTPRMYDVMTKCWLLDPDNRPPAVKVAKELSAISKH